MARADAALPQQRSHRAVAHRLSHGFVLSTGGSVAISGRGRLAAATARLDNRSELAAALGLSPAELSRNPDAALVLSMFERWGADGVARCLGAFAFAHWDEDSRTLTLGRDCLGHHVQFFHRHGDTVTFANRLGVLLAMPDVPREVDELALAHFLTLNGTDPRRTVYRGIERTPARCLVTIDRTGSRHRPYWSPNFDTAPPYRRDADYVERARELFDRAVASATAGADEVAITTSGGLDSSAVAATVARLGTVRRIVCYTALPDADIREPMSPERYREEQVKVEALKRMYPALEVNFVDSNAQHPVENDPALYFARGLVPRLSPYNLGATIALGEMLGRHRLSMTGFYGDLGLTWSGSYALLALARSMQWTSFMRELSLTARRRSLGIPRLLYRDVIRPALPFGLQRLASRLRGGDPYDVSYYSALNPDFIVDNRMHELWREQGFVAGMSDVDGTKPAQFRAWHLFDKTGPHRDNPGWAEQTYGVSVRAPHGDRRLLEFALAIPEPLYARDGVPRSFGRAVFADRLPPEIVHETRRGSNHVGWLRTLDRQRPRIAAELERMEASPTARRLIDIPRLKRLLEDWPKDEAAAHRRGFEYRGALARGVHVGSFIRWVEGGNA